MDDRSGFLEVLAMAVAVAFLAFLIVMVMLDLARWVMG